MPGTVVGRRFVTDEPMRSVSPVRDDRQMRVGNSAIETEESYQQEEPRRDDPDWSAEGDGIEIFVPSDTYSARESDDGLAVRHNGSGEEFTVPGEVSGHQTDDKGHYFRLRHGRTRDRRLDTRRRSHDVLVTDCTGVARACADADRHNYATPHAKPMMERIREFQRQADELHERESAAAYGARRSLYG